MKFTKKQIEEFSDMSEEIIVGVMEEMLEDFQVRKASAKEDYPYTYTFLLSVYDTRYRRLQHIFAVMDNMAAMYNSGRLPDD